MKMNAEHGMRIGIDFGGTNVKVGIFQENGAVISFDEFKVKDLEGVGEFVPSLIDRVTQLAQGHILRGGGLASKGLVDRHQGIVLDDIGAGKSLGGLNIRDAFQNALNIPFIVDNDARAYAWGEAAFGAGKGYNVIVCMTLGTGLGCAVVKDGQPYEGSDPLGGLLGGHISIDRKGPFCSCGNIGCLELFCSATALYKMIRNQHSDLLAATDPLPVYFQRAANQEQPYWDTFREFQRNLAIGIVNVIHAYGPEAVILGGGVMNSADIIMPGMAKLVKKMGWTYPRGKVELVSSELGNRAAAMGIAFHPQLKL